MKPINIIFKQVRNDTMQNTFTQISDSKALVQIMQDQITCIFTTNHNVIKTRGGDGKPALAEVLNVVRVRTLLSVQQTGRIENIILPQKLLHIQPNATFVTLNPRKSI